MADFLFGRLALGTESIRRDTCAMIVREGVPKCLSETEMCTAPSTGLTSSQRAGTEVVELRGFEPLTSSVQRRRSPI